MLSEGKSFKFNKYVISAGWNFSDLILHKHCMTTNYVVLMYISSLPAYCLLKNLIQDITNSVLHMSKNMQIAIKKFPLKYQAMLWRWLWGGGVYEHFS